MIEPLEPLRIRLAGEVRTLEPGHPVALPDEKGQKLLALAGGKVRLVLSDNPQVGEVVTWNSPLFGRISGLVTEALSHGVRVQHPLVPGEAVIPRAWLSKGDKHEGPRG